jgi:hypothetical protein
LWSPYIFKTLLFDNGPGKIRVLSQDPFQINLHEDTEHGFEKRCKWLS